MGNGKTHSPSYLLGIFREINLTQYNLLLRYYIHVFVVVDVFVVVVVVVDDVVVAVAFVVVVGGGVVVVVVVVQQLTNKFVFT